MTESADTPPTDASRRVAALVGVLAAGTALGLAELIAGAVRSWRSPVQAVAEYVIDASPPSLTKFGIETFGTNDKLALVLGILAVLALLAGLVGVLARRRRSIGPVAFGVVGLLGVLATLQTDSLVEAIPSVLAAVIGAAVLDTGLRLAPHPTRTPPSGSASAEVSLDGSSRRAFLGLAAGTAALAGVAAAGGRALRSRFSAAASRMNLRLPGAAAPLDPAPSAASFDIPGLSPLYTPNDTFYRIDTALTVPQVPVEDWTLRVHGMVDEPFEATFDQLVSDFEVIETDITLTCVSNPIGGELVGNARWLGVRLRAVLDRAGVHDDADQIVGRSTDDYTCGFPVEAAYDREAIIAFGMNGEPLPLRHGFPARLVTPGLYGYVSATKWLTEIELTTYADFDQYWVPRGYAEEAPIKTMARIDVPRAGEAVEPGDTVIAGVAWAQPDGISKVEISIDDGPFEEATLAEELNGNTWRQWRHPWTATDGNHRIVVRATDGAGNLQTEERTDVLPDGASGWQSRLVTVRAT